MKLDGSTTGPVAIHSNGLVPLGYLSDCLVEEGHLNIYSVA